MPAFNKSNAFPRDLLNGVHNFGTHTIKVMLTNTAPTAANSVKADLTEIAAGNGYTAGGVTVTATVSLSGGTAKLTLADATLTPTGNVGPFRYWALYNDTPTTPADPLIGWYDYGSAITQASGDPLTFDFDDALGVLTLA